MDYKDEWVRILCSIVVESDLILPLFFTRAWANLCSLVCLLTFELDLLVTVSASLLSLSRDSLGFSFDNIRPNPLLAPFRLSSMLDYHRRRVILLDVSERQLPQLNEACARNERVRIRCRYRRELSSGERMMMRRGDWIRSSQVELSWLDEGEEDWLNWFGVMIWNWKRGVEQLEFTPDDVSKSEEETDIGIRQEWIGTVYEALDCDASPAISPWLTSHVVCPTDSV